MSTETIPKALSPGKAKSFEAIIAMLHARKNGHGWVAQCPCHDDGSPSLSVDEKDDKILLHCHAGCKTEDIVRTLGLTWSSLFTDKTGAIPQSSTQTVTASTVNDCGCTLQAYAVAKQLDVGFLRSLGLSDAKPYGSPIVRIPYLDSAGQETAVRYRVGLSGERRFLWKKGAKPGLYGLWKLQEARDRTFVILCEGESDCHVLWQHGFPALGLPGANQWNEQRDSAYFNDIDAVYVIIEPDQGGKTMLQWLVKSMIKDKVRLVRLDDCKDPAELHAADPAQFASRFQQALDHAERFTDWHQIQLREQSLAHWQHCQALAVCPDILAEFAKDFDPLAAGVTSHAKLLFLVLVSRLLDRPVSIAVKGPSSGGKSYLVEQVLRFFPASAFYCMTAMSERALVYCEESFEHKTLVVFEASGILGDLQSYLLRSLLSENRILYNLVEKTHGTIRGRRLEKAGPTNLIVTTTLTKLHPDNETRLLSLHVRDTREQTKAIMRSQARQDKPSIDFTRWHSLQEWLASNVRPVVIPYAETLSELIPPVSTRLRRDFGMLQSLIRAHALLHQKTRKTNAQGHIVAELADYQIVYDLVCDLLDEVLEQRVSAAVRNTVHCVTQLLPTFQDGVSVKQIAVVLKLDHSTAWRRVRQATGMRYLKNLEERASHPARIALAEAVPEDCSVLPSPNQLAKATGYTVDCTIAGNPEGVLSPPLSTLPENNSTDSHSERSLP